MSAELDYLAHLARDSERFLDVLAELDPAKPVPSCPDWTAVDLLWHLTEVQLFWGAIVRGRLSDPDEAERSKPDRPTDFDALVHLCATAGTDLHDVLAATPDDTAVWTWAEDKTAGFVRRRQAHEALIHRVDAELTAGDPSVLDPALASDGVDEALRVMHGGIPAWGRFDPDGVSAAIESTDTGARWLVGFGRFEGTHPRSGTHYDEDALDVMEDAGEPTAVVRGPAADLDCWAWGRLAAERLDRSGDPDVLRRLLSIVDQGID